MKGSQHDDTITIHHGAVFAGPGNDRIMFDTGGGNLWGQAGDDMLTAGPTATVLRGGEGDDTLQSRDGVADVDNCSTGVDSVTADAMDSVVNNCENVSIG